MSQMKFGMIGLDTSHAIAFTKLLNDPRHPYHIPGGEVTVAFPGGSPDMELSHSRVKDFTTQMRDEWNGQIVDSPEAVAEQSDAILLESVDGRVHLEQFSKIAPYGKPTFIDKPFATTSEDATEIFRLAKQYDTPVMSCSSLRFAQGITSALHEINRADIYGVDCYGPLALEPTHGLFWYGIHTVEMLYRVLGRGCKSVMVTKNNDHDLVIGEWQDGRIGTIRGNRVGNSSFGALIHGQEGIRHVDIDKDQKPFYASLLEEIIRFFKERTSTIHQEETLEITRFIEAASESREAGIAVKL